MPLFNAEISVTIEARNETEATEKLITTLNPVTETVEVDDIEEVIGDEEEVIFDDEEENEELEENDKK